MKNKIIEGVNKYYTSKVLQHGITPEGVDWNSKESQYIRFNQLSGIITGSTDFSILDFGCGYGEYYNYLLQNFDQFRYYGYDISQAMIDAANNLCKDSKNAEFMHQIPDKTFNYVIASGIFNVKLELANDKEWLEYILQTLQTLNKLSTNGFSFNALTSYSDSDHMKDYLYYADPLFLFDYCKKNFSRNVALLHDYDLYEFTLLVRK